MSSILWSTALALALSSPFVEGAACNSASCDAEAGDDPSMLQTAQQRGQGQTRRRKTKPHIVFALADDLGWTSVGYNAKISVEQIDPNLRVFEAEANFTPNLDKMAVEDGVVLRRHYAYTACTPSRMSLMTGRLPVRTGVLLGEIWSWDGGV